MRSVDCLGLLIPARFISRQQHTLFVSSENHLASQGPLRQCSPFLHSVCCLHEMRYNQSSRDESVTLRLVYEHVRQMLGQVMLASPLRVEEITGVLVMAMFATSPSVRSPFK